MNYLLIIVLVASILNLAFNAYLYFTDKSISHVILGISYTAQSAQKKADDAFALAKRLEWDWIDFSKLAFENKSGVEFFKSELLVQGNLIKELKKELSESLANGDTVAEKIHDSLALLHERQMELTAKLSELEAYVTAPITAALPEPNEADLKQEMEDSLEAEPSKNYNLKPISEWLKDLPEPYRQQALDEFERQGWADIVSFGLSYTLAKAFDWTESPQGRQYWMAICEYIDGVGALPTPWTPPTEVDEPTECAEPCGMNMCEENGCANRKRVYVDPPTADSTEAVVQSAPEPKPRKSRRPIPRNGIK